MGMNIKLASGQILTGKEKSKILYEMNIQILPSMEGNKEISHLEPSFKISLKPLLQTYHRYNPHWGQYIEDIFPPSTLGFYGRMKTGREKFLYIVQEIEDDSRLWLTIADANKGEIYEAHTIHQFEVESISLIDSQEFRHKWYETIWSEIPSSERDEILNILDSPTVSWSDFAKLLEDVSVPNLELGKTMRDTFSQLIPSNFPEEVQEQLMLFLAFISMKKAPNEDPIDYLYKFWSFPILGALMEGHLMCLVDGVDCPPYLKLLTLANRQHLIAPTRAIENIVMDSPWLLFWQKTIEQFPNWFNIAAEMVKDLNARESIVTKPPITESAAKRSKELWKKRLAILIYELRIMGRTNSQSLGLKELVYLGSAYRWPHRHMKFITQLGSTGENPPYLQVMVMPPSAAVRVKRVLPAVVILSWITRTSNIDLFDLEKKKWVVPTEQIISSIANTSSLNKITNRFGIKRTVDNYRITSKEAKVLDLAAEGIRLAGIERSEYLKPWGLDWKQIRFLLSNLSNRDVIQLFYEVSDQKLISLATIIQGPPERVLSLCSSMLEYTPTTLAMIGERSDQAVLLTRIPETPAYEIASQLPTQGLEQGLTIRCLRPTKYQSYSHNLYQRLLREDGTWDDDVSAFLSQARSKRRELSESNA